MIPAVLSTKKAHEYCGGRPIWEELTRAYPKLRPLRTTLRGDAYWRRETIDHFISLAEMEGKLIQCKEPATA
jgi:hypothetical protein